MRLFGHEFTGFPKAIVILAAIFLIASGLCSIDQVVAERHGWFIMGPWGDTLLADVLGAIDVFTYVAIMLSGIGLVITLLTWPIVRLGRKRTVQLVSKRKIDSDASKNNRRGGK